jgi:hypothetical protein
MDFHLNKKKINDNQNGVGGLGVDETRIAIFFIHERWANHQLAPIK